MAFFGSDFELMKWNSGFRSQLPLPTDPVERRLLLVKRLAVLGSLLTMILGISVAFAHLFGFPLIASFRPEFVSMKFNTALSFFCLGLALYVKLTSSSRSRVGPWLIPLLSLGSGLIGGLTLLEYASGIDLYADQLFVSDKLSLIQTSHPGRMAGATAVNILLMSISILLPLGAKSNMLRIGSFFFCFFVAYINFCGYVFGIESFYHYTAQTAMAAHTAAGFIVLSMSLISAFPQEKSVMMILAETPAGYMLRRMLPAALVLPFLLGWIRTRPFASHPLAAEISIALFSISYSVIFIVLIWRNALVIEKMSHQKATAEKQRDSAEQAALRQAKRVSSIMENIGDAVITVNQKGIIKSINQATLQIFGYRSCDLIGASVGKLVSNQMRHRYMMVIRSHLSGKEQIKLGNRRELEARKKNGAIFPIDLVISEFSIGQERYFTGVIRDITERKKSQEALRRWEYIFKNAQWAITVSNPENDTIIDVNPAFAEMHGYSVEELIGLPLSITVAPEEQGNLSAFSERIIETDELLYESTHIRKNGERFAVLIHVNSFKDEFGQILFRAATCQDISARKEAEENLQRLREDLELRVAERTQKFADEVAERKRIQESLERKEAELLLITHAIPAALVYIDHDERYVFCNKTFETWIGLSQSEIVGKTVKEHFSPSYYATIRPFLDQVYSGQVCYHEANVTFNDRERTVAINGVPDFDNQGNIRGMVLLSSDVSSLMEAQAELKAATIAADDANRAKSAFLANMSHEIRTPLGAVMGFSELLTNPCLLPTERANYLAAIKRNGEMLSNIINDILDISKVEAGRLEITSEEVDVAELIGDTMALLNLQASEKAIQLSVFADGPIPQYIHTDPLRLKQILSNVAGNAIKFTDKGHVLIRIRQVAHQNGLRLAFIVTDTGPGITDEQAQRLFAPFSQADASTTRKFGGTGLGLALARRLAQLLGGEVELTSSQAGKGSTFTITIDPGSVSSKLFVKYPDQRPKNEAPLSVLPREVSLRGLDVLLAEDAPDNQMLITHYLRMAGAHVDAACNGREACEKVLSGHYDVVLMDLQMPVMDGFEATAALRRAGFGKPILALTAHAMKEDRLRCLANGFDDHLSKPIDGQLLIERVALLGQGEGLHPH